MSIADLMGLKWNRFSTHPPVNPGWIHACLNPADNLPEVNTYYVKQAAVDGGQLATLPGFWHPDTIHPSVDQINE